MLQFWKYHGLGNDYLVLEPGQLAAPLSPGQRRWLCDRHYGVGADGVLVGPEAIGPSGLGLRIYNPDGSEAEKSGNGLRIFARHLWERGRLALAAAEGRQASSLSTPIWTAGGVVEVQVLEGGLRVRVAMGQARFEDASTGVDKPEIFLLNGMGLQICPVNLGNPHCVVFCPQAPTRDLALSLGPQLEVHPRFPQRANVQFMHVLDRHNLQIEIWERGAGYTLASGSSSCAAAAAAYRFHLCANQVNVHMPGGCLEVDLGPDYQVNQTGPVEKIYQGWIEELRSL